MGWFNDVVCFLTRCKKKNKPKPTTTTTKRATTTTKKPATGTKTPATTAKTKTASAITAGTQSLFTAQPSVTTVVPQKLQITSDGKNCSDGCTWNIRIQNHQIVKLTSMQMDLKSGSKGYFSLSPGKNITKFNPRGCFAVGKQATQPCLLEPAISCEYSNGSPNVSVFFKAGRKSDSFSSDLAVQNCPQSDFVAHQLTTKMMTTSTQKVTGIPIAASMSAGTIAGLAVAVVLLLVALIVAICLYWRRKNSSKKSAGNADTIAHANDVTPNDVRGPNLYETDVGGTYAVAGPSNEHEMVYNSIYQSGDINKQPGYNASQKELVDNPLYTSSDAAHSNGRVMVDNELYNMDEKETKDNVLYNM